LREAKAGLPLETDSRYYGINKASIYRWVAQTARCS